MKLLVILSGEALAGGTTSQYDKGMLDRIAADIAALLAAGHRVGLVVGGGNLFRGGALSGALSIDRSTADFVGMLATIQNALVLRDHFSAHGVTTRVMSAIEMREVCEPYIEKRAERHFEKGRIVIFAGGLGVPYFTTDTTAVQRALELRMDMLVLAKNGVDGLYTADPKTDPSAQKIDTTTATAVLSQGLRVADQAAVALAKEHHLPIKVIGLADLPRAIEPGVGSYVAPE